MRFLFVAWVVLIAAATTSAQSSWSNPVSGSFHTASYWTLGVPGASSTAYFGWPATYTVSFSSAVSNLDYWQSGGQVTLDLGGQTYSLTNATGIRLGSGLLSNDTLTVTNGTMSLAYAGVTTYAIANSSSSTATLNVGSGGTFTTNSNWIHLGGPGTANVNASSGGQFFVGGSTRLGQSGSTANLTVTGSGSLFSGGNVNTHGTANVSIAAGATMTTTSFVAAVTGVTTIALGGAGTTWNTGSYTSLGNANGLSTTLAITSGATWNVGELTIGTGTTGSGHVTMTGGSVVQRNDSTYFHGTSQWDQTGGSTQWNRLSLFSNSRVRILGGSLSTTNAVQVGNNIASTKLDVQGASWSHAGATATVGSTEANVAHVAGVEFVSGSTVTLSHPGGTVLRIDSGGLVENNGGTVATTGDILVQKSQGSGQVANFRLGSGSWTHTGNVTLSANGTIGTNQLNLVGGNLTILGAGNGLHVQGNASFATLAGGTLTTPNLSLGASSNFTHQGAGVTIDGGSLTNAGSQYVYAGSLTLRYGATIGGNQNWFAATAGSSNHFSLTTGSQIALNQLNVSGSTAGTSTITIAGLGTSLTFLQNSSFIIGSTTTRTLATISQAAAVNTSVGVTSITNGELRITSNSTFLNRTITEIGALGRLTIDGGTYTGLATMSDGSPSGISFSAGTIALESGTMNIPSDAIFLTLGTFQHNGGRLNYTTTSSISRNMAINGGTLTADAGTTITLHANRITGGTLAGPGQFDTVAGQTARLVGGTLSTSGQLTLNGSDDLTNYNLGGQTTVALGATPTLTRVTQGANGRATVYGLAAVSEFTSLGVLTVTGTATPGRINNAGTDLYLGGGSRTFVGGVPAAQRGGTIDLGGYNLHLNGGLLVNNGDYVSNGVGGIQNGVTRVNYGSLAKGTGYYEEVVVTQGGKFAPGNSIANATVGTLTLEEGSAYEFEINRALGTAGGGGGSPPVGWDLLNLNVRLRINATNASPAVIELVSRNAADTGPGTLPDFNAANSYSWTVFRANPGAVIEGFSPDKFVVDTAQFANLPNPAGIGTFALRQSGNDITLNYTPVPEPVVVLALAAIAAWVISISPASRGFCVRAVRVRSGSC
jgi:hypothetical protein